MFYYSYTKLQKILGCEALHEKTKGAVFVVMGFQRSGTSLLANIINSCGVFFGDQSDLKQALITNPDGFFEHKEISSLNWSYISEAGYRDNVDFDRSLNPKGTFDKIKRLATERSMHKVLYTLSQKASKWGIKNFPLFYYIWREYLPAHKIVAIYRDPRASAHSYMNIWPSKYTYEYVLSMWLQAQKDMIYHLSLTDHILIKYEELIDKEHNSRILDQIINFIGEGNSVELQRIIKPELNRTDKELYMLIKHYPLKQEVQDVLEQLNKIKI